MKLNALIVDDEHSGRVSLKILLKNQFNYLFDKIITASSLPQAIEIAADESFNICFLDIELNNQSGFDLLTHLSKATKVIFVTAYSEYAIRAIREKAYDYLLKPINPAEFTNCIKRFEEEIKQKDSTEFLLVKEQGFTVPLHFNEIVYVEANGPYSKVYVLNNKQYTMSKTLKALGEILNTDFIRIHKSYIVNKTKVQSFKKDNLITTTNVCLPVSRLGAKVLSQYF